MFSLLSWSSTSGQVFSRLKQRGTETHEVYKIIYGSETISHTHVLEWFKRFREGHEDHKDNQGVGGHQLFKIQKHLQKLVNAGQRPLNDKKIDGG
jgi:hypothetical protein